MNFLRAIPNRIKASSVFFILMLSACAQSNTSSELFWDYAPFQSSPKIALQQAHSICDGYANNAANIAGRHNSYPASTSDFGTQLTSIYINKANMQSAYNNIYTSCMAQNGWNAQLTRRVTSSESDIRLITCKKKNGETMKIQITTDACLYNGGTVL